MRMIRTLVLTMVLLCQCHLAAGSGDDRDRLSSEQPLPYLGEHNLASLGPNHWLEIAKSNRNGETALKGAEAMHRFLNKWKAVGRPAAEVEAMFGKPDRNYGRFCYYFDTGNFGRVFEFHFRGRKVISWEHKGY